MDQHGDAQLAAFIPHGTDARVIDAYAVTLGVIVVHTQTFVYFQTIGTEPDIVFELCDRFLSPAGIIDSRKIHVCKYDKTIGVMFLYILQCSFEMFIRPATSS